ncbi:aminopeptidase P family protein [Stieleria sp. TO1_6]|uniref:M24 family metallopeptidase n=1 Tax=Stieleria tagensis TaxID=2956795 RepID=UPI00209AF7F2|nr:M24 family metallopeptidase [Stieleria tagensis]MCO8123455.1 aminopeptidase P family protein [Stieleria tagensis]
MPNRPSTVIFAGIADKNPSLYRRVRVALGDPSAWVQTNQRSVALVRDLEMDRVRANSDADQVVCPADYTPPESLDPDRETATAQAVAEFCRREGIVAATVDRSLPYIFAWHLQQSGVELTYDPDLGVVDRRQKSEQEIEALIQSQSVTETVMRLICELIAHCPVNADGLLMHDGQVLTSQRTRAIAAAEFLKRDYSMSHGAIVATAPEVADCHHAGDGPLRVNVPVIVDLFPMNNQTRYWGDCTRTVVNGQPSETVQNMHRAVIRAKHAAANQLRVGNTADQVHRASDAALMDGGYELSRGKITDQPSLQHGTGHGIGLEVHEPILLDFGGGPLLEREVFTIEPGLYGRNDGGVRVEDMLVVREGDAQCLNQLHDGLDWK